MRAYINTACEVRATYRWVQLAEAVMIVDGVRYSGLSGKARTVYCRGRSCIAEVANEKGLVGWPILTHEWKTF